MHVVKKALILITFLISTNNFLHVFDVLGKQIITQTINAKKTYIDLSSEGPGIYILKLMTDEKIVIKKIIIE